MTDRCVIPAGGGGHGLAPPSRRLSPRHATAQAVGAFKLHEADFVKQLLQACHMRKQDVRRHGRDAPQLRLLSSVSPHAPPSLLLQGVQSAYSDRAVEGILPVAMYAVLLAQLGLYLVLANVQIDFSLVIGWMGLQYLVTSSLPMLWGYFIMTLVSLPVDLVRRGTARSCRPAPCCARRAALPAPSALNALGPGRWRSARRSGEGRWTCSNSSRALHDRTPAAPCRIAASCAGCRCRYVAYFLIVLLKGVGLLGAIAMHTKFNCRLRFRADDVDDPARRLRPGDSLAA